MASGPIGDGTGERFLRLHIGDLVLFDVPFICALCGPRYWQVPADTPEDQVLARAIREEAEWHADNLRRYGSVFPIGLEPWTSGFSDYRFAVSRCARCGAAVSSSRTFCQECGPRTPRIDLG